MPDREVVSNTSPLLYLHQVGQLEILARLYGRVLIPPAVRAELDTGRHRGISVPDLDRFPWIESCGVPPELALPTLKDLGAGEAEVLALGRADPRRLLILDEEVARRAAEAAGLEFTGTLGVLLRAKEHGLLPAVAPVVEALTRTSMWLSSELIDLVLTLAGETRRA